MDMRDIIVKQIIEKSDNKTRDSLLKLTPKEAQAVVFKNHGLGLTYLGNHYLSKIFDSYAFVIKEPPRPKHILYFERYMQMPYYYSETDMTLTLYHEEIAMTLRLVDGDLNRVLRTKVGVNGRERGRDAKG